MREAVNSVRAEHGLAAVPAADIARADRLAAGHSEYSRKFAFSPPGSPPHERCPA